MLSVEIVRPMESLIDEVKLCKKLLYSLSTKLDTLNTAFSWCFALLALWIIIAPILCYFLFPRHYKTLSEKISSLEAQIKDLQQKLS